MVRAHRAAGDSGGKVNHMGSKTKQLSFAFCDEGDPSKSILW